MMSLGDDDPEAKAGGVQYRARLGTDMATILLHITIHSRRRRITFRPGRISRITITTSDIIIPMGLLTIITPGHQIHLVVHPIRMVTVGTPLTPGLRATTHHHHRLLRCMAGRRRRCIDRTHHRAHTWEGHSGVMFGVVIAGQ